MLKIRLRRMGMKKQPTYRIVVAESTAPRDGRFVEIIGTYNPRTEPETVEIKEARALHWLSVGAQPTPSAARILRTHGTTARFERLRAGEELEALVAEAESAAEELETEEEEETVEAAEAEATVSPEDEEDPDVAEDTEEEEEEAAEDTAEVTEQASDESVETEESEEA